ncbi:MAG: hypothetical protein CMP07_04670 [Xanthomonadales bacterium]|nr:hypothetical protein [Xanthomonadales bacterium]
MANFRKWTKRLGIALLALLAVLAVLWGLSRALYPTAEQRDALALMQQPPPPPGENAFAAMWTLDHAVPAEEMAGIVGHDSERLEALQATRALDESDPAGFESARDQYPDLSPSESDRMMFCAARDGNCLERVGEDPAGYRELVERNRQLIDRGDALADYDHYRSLLPANWETLSPPLSAARFPATRQALWFVEGRTDEALAATCRNIAGWRRLTESADQLVVRMLGQLFVTELHGSLLAEMLAEMPADHPLPANCKPALAAPTPSELSLCRAMRGEYAFGAWAMESIETLDNSNLGPLGRLRSAILFSAEATNAERAVHFAQTCSDAELSRIVADIPEVDAPEPAGLIRLACVGNFIGCALNGIAAPAYTDYRLRAQDYGARLELLATLTWLRENAERPGPIDELLDQRPESLRSPTRRVEIGEDGDSLRVRMFGARDGETWSVPLPAALQQ